MRGPPRGPGPTYRDRPLPPTAPATRLRTRGRPVFQSVGLTPSPALGVLKGRWTCSFSPHPRDSLVAGRSLAANRRGWTAAHCTACQLTIGAPVNLDLKLQLTQGCMHCSPSALSTGLCPPRSGRRRNWEGGAGQAPVSQCGGPTDPPPRAPECPFSGLGLTTATSCAPLPPGWHGRSPASRGYSSTPPPRAACTLPTSGTRPPQPLHPPQRPGQTSRDPPGSGRL